MGLLENAADWLSERRKEYLSVQITYQGKGESPIPMTATVGRTLFRAENEYGVTIRTESRDFLVSIRQMPTEPRI